MKIGIIDDDTQFSQVIKNKIEENTCFSESSIDVFNNDFKSLQLKDYDYLFIDNMKWRGGNKKSNSP